VTGRKKDIIIKAGRNIYPDAAEEITGNIDGVRKGCVVAFGVEDPAYGTEKFVIVAEIREQQRQVKDRIHAEIIDKVTIATGIPPDEVILTQPKIIPKTSSGKLRRSACKQMYVNKKLTAGGLPVWLQLSKLLGLAIFKKVRSAFSLLLKLLYSGYLWLIAIVTLPFLYLGVVLTSRKTGARLVKFWNRNMLRLAFCPLKIEGKENLTKYPNMIFVANHASYLDAAVLTGILPTNIFYIAKKPLLKAPILRTFLKNLDYIMVDYLDFTESVADINKMNDKLKQKHSLVIFPEATFTYTTGLRPFKLGAFKIAAENNIPICPIGIDGTRYCLRQGSYLPRIGRIKVSIGEPIFPQGQDFQDITRLRDLTRSEIAKRCGESPLDVIAAGPPE